MATTTVKIDIKSYECPLCLHTFQDPRLLPCGHTVCGPKSSDKCIEGLDPRKIGKLRCPHCQIDHYVVVARLPPDYKARELLESYNASKLETNCLEHGKELILRCVTDGKEICVDCVTDKHLGHQFEGIHDRERKRLCDYWKSQNAELDEMQLKCRQRINTVEQEVEFLQNQLLQERSLDKNIGFLKDNRDVITKKLESKSFNPEDDEILAMKVFMDQLKATSDNQQEASQEVRKHNKEIMQLVDSRTATFCKSINISMSDANVTQTNQTKSSRLLTPCGTSASSAGHSGDREPVQSQRTTNILAWGSWNQYVLRLCDNTWQQWKGRTESLDVIGCEVMCYNKKVYIIGGIDIQIYSIQENKWSEGPNLPVHPSVYILASCLLESNRTIYVCRGCDEHFASQFFYSVQKLKLDENGDPVGEWTRVKPMKENRYDCAAVAVGNRIFVIGGENEKNQALSSVEVYDINTGEWSYGPPMKHSRRYHAAVEYQGNIYVMGGKTENDERTSSCEKLDVQRLTWTTIESMRVPRSEFGAVVANNKVYVIGGYTDGSEENRRSVEVYDIASNTWSRGPKLPETMGFTRCVSW